jgi:precorrin-6B methylase 2
MTTLAPFFIALLFTTPLSAQDVGVYAQPETARNQPLFDDVLRIIQSATGVSHTLPLQGNSSGSVIRGFGKPPWIKATGVELTEFEIAITDNVVDFVMTAVAASEDRADTLADALRAYLIPMRRNTQAAQELLSAVRAAMVANSGKSVRLSITLSPAAIARLRNSTTVGSLLRWDFDVDQRETWQRTDAILSALSVATGSKVADIGASDGYMSVKLARLVGTSGKVFAVDIDKDTLGELRWRAEGARLSQIEVIVGDVDNPRLPPNSLDAALIVNSYHEMSEHRTILKHVFAALKPGGRLVLVEPFAESTRTSPRAEQEKKHQIAPEIVAEDLGQTGFEVTVRDDGFIKNRNERQSLVVGRKP